MDKWDMRFYNLARYIGEEWSKDPTTKVGAVLVGITKTEVALGYNGFPHGIEDDQERLNDREQRRLLMQHAERNVLDNATFPTAGSVLYSSLFPCPECAKSMITKGVIRVVAPDWRDLPERKHLRSMQAASILAEAGIQVVKI